ncbi:hypothetical protein F2Q68_00039157 [Brassica cretica]|uniref:CCHC-type domain-containing protein n=1 Tax=Brassica cretica TaxID=69181 RepID=A0A8S9MG34_BRACR|nr:hypothetical protein F2Q68_00039157 [Brassica cretica]
MKKQRSGGRSDTDASTTNELSTVYDNECMRMNKTAKGRGSRGLVFDLGTCEARVTSQDGLDLVEVLFKEIFEVEEDNDPVSLIARRFDKVLRRAEMVGDYHELCQTIVQIGKENLFLKKEKLWLEEVVMSLRKELDDEQKKDLGSIDLKKENLNLVVKIGVLEKEIDAEKKKSLELHATLEHHYKTVRMLTGSKDLDKILSVGRQEHTIRGLGYTGYGEKKAGPINFVPSSNTEGKTQTAEASYKQTKDVKKMHEPKRMNGCYYYGKPGHIKRKCYHYRERVNQFLRQGKYWWNGFKKQV